MLIGKLCSDVTSSSAWLLSNKDKCFVSLMVSGMYHKFMFQLLFIKYAGENIYKCVVVREFLPW